jgi:arylsulfatase A-like enzyme
MKPGPFYLFSSSLAAFALIVAAHPARAADARPNIVHIVADDLGWKDVGFNGCRDIMTPNLDALAAAGAKLTQFYVQPMCTPTRACLMTGRYPFRYGLQTAVIPSTSAYGLDTSEWLMPQCLKEAGYKTAIIGKWHLGHADKKYWPKQRGFDYQYGAMIGELDYFSHDEQYTDRYASIKDPTRRTYAAMVACLDDEIGRVVAALDKKKMRDNTLILFHSDNGGTRSAMFAGVMADMSKVKIPCDNGPYREGKGTLYEGATRVCALANWPGRVKSGNVDGLIHAVDIYPTLAALAGASTANCKALDGVNVWDTISQGKPSPRNEIVYNVEPFRAAIRQGEWKLIWRTLLPSRVELYNIVQDPSETNNLAAQHPEKVTAFQGRLDTLAKESAKPLFLVDQFKVVMKGLHGEPILPTDDDFAGVEGS